MVDDVTPSGVERGRTFATRPPAPASSRWFGPEVTAPVALHVAAKRYLCAVDAGYCGAVAGLGSQSALQGGPMTEAEIVDFERNVHHRARRSLRRWDDRAKVQGLEVPAFEKYQDLLHSLTTGHVHASDRTSPSRTPERVAGLSTMSPELRVGCALWAHKPWIGRFTSGHGTELTDYASWCNAVEGNTTFYAVPSAATVDRWSGQAPVDFRFAFKVPHVVTHEQHLRTGAHRDVAAFLARDRTPR